MKVISFTCVFNEERFIERCIDNALSQGMTPIVINNGCTDNTLNIVQKLGIPIFDYITPTFELQALIGHGAEVARNVGCDWYVLQDADELMETYDGRRVVDVIEEEDGKGFNCMNFDSYSFWPTEADDVSEKDFTKRIRHYTFFDIPYTRAVKNSPEIGLDHPHLPGGEQHLSPVNMVIRHYKFLDAEHGREKVCARRARYDPWNIAQGSHTHYNNVGIDDEFFVLKPEVYNKLNIYNGAWVRQQVWDEWRDHGKD